MVLAHYILDTRDMIMDNNGFKWNVLDRSDVFMVREEIER